MQQSSSLPYIAKGRTEKCQETSNIKSHSFNRQSQKPHRFLPLGTGIPNHSALSQRNNIIIGKRKVINKHKN